jgi:CBS domain-containing protein
MKVRDVMTTSVVSVTSDETVKDIATLLLQQRISAVFVVDDAGFPIGVVSEGDLMRRAETDTERTRSWWLRQFLDSSVLATEYAKSHGRRARDVMSRPVISVSEDTTLNEAATLLETHRIKRLPVFRDGSIVGVISRANLVRALASIDSTPKTTEDLDRSIRDKLAAELKSQPWASADTKNIIVENGVVHLWGLIASEEERTATRVATEQVPGVRAIEDHLVLRPLVRMDA